MSGEQEIRVGQIWASNDGKRTVRVTRYDSAWDDVRWRNDETKRGGCIYGSYLRARYTLVSDA